MGTKNLVVSTTGHPGQQQGSSRKKQKRWAKRTALRERAAAQGVSVSDLAKHNQRQVDGLRKDAPKALIHFSSANSHVISRYRSSF